MIRPRGLLPHTARRRPLESGCSYVTRRHDPSNCDAGCAPASAGTKAAQAVRKGARTSGLRCEGRFLVATVSAAATTSLAYEDTAAVAGRRRLPRLPTPPP